MFKTKNSSLKLPINHNSISTNDNVIKYYLNDNMWFVLRPSGTEPKIKFYFGAKGESAEATLDLLVREFSE